MIREIPDQILEIGSRNGATFALFFFGILFLVLGWAVTSSLTRHGVAPKAYWLFGPALFALPISAVYLSRLSGFYEVESGSNRVTLKYLAP